MALGFQNIYMITYIVIIDSIKQHVHIVICSSKTHLLLLFLRHPLRMLAAEGVSDGGSPITHQTKVTILNFALELALQLTELYAGLPSFPEIFTPITTSILR